MPYSPEEQKIAADFIDFCARQNKLPSALDIDDVVKKYRAANVFGKPKAPGMTGWGPSQEELGRSKIAPKVPSSFVPETISEVGKMPGYDKGGGGR